MIYIRTPHWIYLMPTIIIFFINEFVDTGCWSLVVLIWIVAFKYLKIFSWDLSLSFSNPSLICVTHFFVCMFSNWPHQMISCLLFLFGIYYYLKFSYDYYSMYKFSHRVFCFNSFFFQKIILTLHSIFNEINESRAETKKKSEHRLLYKQRAKTTAKKYSRCSAKNVFLGQEMILLKFSSYLLSNVKIYIFIFYTHTIQVSETMPF